MLRFMGDGDQKKFTKNPRHFSMQNSQANTKKIFKKFFWRAGKVTFGVVAIGIVQCGIWASKILRITFNLLQRMLKTACAPQKVLSRRRHEMNRGRWGGSFCGTRPPVALTVFSRAGYKICPHPPISPEWGRLQISCVSIYYFVSPSMRNVCR